MKINEFLVGVVLEQGACPVWQKGASPKINKGGGSNEVVILEQGARKNLTGNME